MVSSYKPDFSVEWKDPADAQLTWLYDPMHQPAPTCALAAEFWARMYGAYMSARMIQVNGFVYATGLEPRPPAPEIVERGVLDVWTKDYQPAVQAACERIRSRNYDAMSLTELGDAADGIIAEAVSGFGNTMKPISAFMGQTFGMVGFLLEELGPTGPRLGATLLQGFENGTAAAGAGLSELAEEAAKRPAVAAALREGAYDKLDTVEGGPDFMAKFRAYLEEYGWRVETWGGLDRPTWVENPRMPLMLIARFIADPERSPAVAHRRSVEQRETAQREVEAALKPDKLPAFRGMLSAAQSHVPISEGRAMWQLITVGSLRVPFLALGRKLVAAGALSKPEQAVLFTTAELREAAHNPTPALRATADEREKSLAEWRDVIPPPFIGAPPDMSQIPPERLPILTLFFGIAPPDVQGKEIKGQAASKGVVRGTARVIRDLSEAERLQPGEILVCQTTAPPWTPLFAIAAAVVTDSGGVLSHSAICAREYAIPCVVATQVGTQMIKDGATITVDGGRGTVQLEA